MQWGKVKSVVALCCCYYCCCCMMITKVTNNNNNDTNTNTIDNILSTKSRSKLQNMMSLLGLVLNFPAEGPRRYANQLHVALLAPSSFSRSLASPRLALPRLALPCLVLPCILSSRGNNLLQTSKFLRKHDLFHHFPALLALIQSF